jgi:hypothetical protein
MLAQLVRPPDQPGRRGWGRLSAPDPLAEGSWHGRWGLNYFYGTWSVLCALNAAGVDHQDPVMRKAVDWLVSIQNVDGGWGGMPPATGSTIRDLKVRPRPPRKRMGFAWIDGGGRGRAPGGRTRWST